MRGRIPGAAGVGAIVLAASFLFAPAAGIGLTAQAAPQDNVESLCRQAEADIQKYVESGRVDKALRERALRAAMKARMTDPDSPLPPLVLSRLFAVDGDPVWARSLALKALSLAGPQGPFRGRAEALVKETGASKPVPRIAPDLDSWEILNGRWEARDGVLYGSGDGHILFKRPSSDYILRFTVECLGEGGWTIGAGFRGKVISGGAKKFRNGTSDLEGYTFNFASNRTYNIFKSIGGRWQGVKKPGGDGWVASELLSGAVKEIAVEAVGDSYRILVDGMTIAFFQEGTHAGGAPFIWSGPSTNTIRLTDLEVQALPGAMELRTFANGETYYGQIVDNRKHGYGLYTWPNGDRYTGQFRDDKINGRGTKRYFNGDEYRGEWKNDLRHGQGAYHEAASGKSFSGEWRDGKWVQK